MRFADIYRMNKKAAEMLTPEAQTAAAQPPMPPQGAPMEDPSMMGAPAGAPPMDPAMGGMPPQVAPAGAWMQDPMFMDFLMQMGVQVDPNSGMAVDPNGQQIPPALMLQIYAMFMQQMAAQPQGAPPMDPAMGGMPPQGAPMEDPSMMGAPAGAPPMDPAMGAPMEMPPLLQANMIASIIMDSVNAVLDLKLAVVDKKISAFADKLDSIKNMLDDLALSRLTSKQLSADNALNDELLMLLRNQKPMLMPKQASYKPGNMLSLLRGSL